MIHLKETEEEITNKNILKNKKHKSVRNISVEKQMKEEKRYKTRKDLNSCESSSRTYASATTTVAIRLSNLVFLEMKRLNIKYLLE